MIELSFRLKRRIKELEDQLKTECSCSSCRSAHSSECLKSFYFSKNNQNFRNDISSKSQKRTKISSDNLRSSCWSLNSSIDLPQKSFIRKKYKTIALTRMRSMKRKNMTCQQSSSKNSNYEKKSNEEITQFKKNFITTVAEVHPIPAVNSSLETLGSFENRSTEESSNNSNNSYSITSEEEELTNTTESFSLPYPLSGCRCNVCLEFLRDSSKDFYVFSGDTGALFPVGSRVLLVDGREATVLYFGHKNVKSMQLHNLHAGPAGIAALFTNNEQEFILLEDVAELLDDEVETIHISSDLEDFNSKSEQENDNEMLIDNNFDKDNDKFWQLEQTTGNKISVCEALNKDLSYFKTEEGSCDNKDGALSLVKENNFNRETIEYHNKDFDALDFSVNDADEITVVYDSKNAVNNENYFEHINSNCIKNTDKFQVFDNIPIKSDQCEDNYSATCMGQNYTNEEVESCLLALPRLTEKRCSITSVASSDCHSIDLSFIDSDFYTDNFDEQTDGSINKRKSFDAQEKKKVKSCSIDMQESRMFFDSTDSGIKLGCSNNEKYHHEIDTKNGALPLLNINDIENNCRKEKKNKFLHFVERVDSFCNISKNKTPQNYARNETEDHSISNISYTYENELSSLKKVRKKTRCQNNECLKDSSSATTCFYLRYVSFIIL